LREENSQHAWAERCSPSMPHRDLNNSDRLWIATKTGYHKPRMDCDVERSALNTPYTWSAAP
jgi:hypothetical protein